MHENRPDSVPPAEEPLSQSLSFAGLTDFLGRPAEAESDDLPSGAVVGDVRILRFVGAGGMGRVYEGVQDTTQRTVAVKVMRPGIVSAAAARRLAHEAQILGRLSDPGIARIYSAGVTRVAGRDLPYFVMEYVDQPRSITAYAAEHRLSQRARVELFRQACVAVAHGHDRGIVHRDLKPGNMLVDSSGQPKIIDFGVARCTADDGLLTTMHTGVGDLLGTAQYMAPEQLVGTDDDIDARADVYALGLVLYELLTGVLPYDVRNRPVYEVARIVSDVEPRSLATVDRHLRGDLSAIVGTCLDKDRRRRYPTAAALGADIDRHLRGEPITARAPGLIESLARLASRHRTAALGLAAVLITLVVAAVGMSILAVRATIAADQARQQLYRANIRSLQSFLESRNPRAARAVYDETMAISGEPLPLELRCLGAELDDALVVLEPDGDPVVDVAFAPAGDRLEVTTGRLTEGVFDHADTEAIARRPGLLRRGLDRTTTSFLLTAGDGFERLTNGETTSVSPASPTARAGEVWAASTNGRRLTVAHDGRVVLQRESDCENVATLGELRGRIKRVAFSPGGARAVVLREGGQFDLWHGETGEFIATCTAGGPVEDLIFSPNGSRLVAVERLPGASASLGVFDLDSGEPLTTIQIQGSLATDDLLMAFSPDGQRLATSAQDNGIAIWDIRTGMLEQTLIGHTSIVTVLVWSGDGRQIASGGSGGQLFLWAAASGQFEHRLLGHEGAVLTVAFTPDGERLASGGLDGTVRFWSRSQRRSLDKLPLAGRPTALAFSPDGQDLAVAAEGGDLELWNSATVERRQLLPVDGAAVAGVSYAPDGGLLAAALNPTDGSGEVRIWNTETGREVASFGGLEQGAVGSLWSGDGSRVVTTSRDGSAAVWSVADAKQLWSAKADASRSLAKPLAVFGLGGKVVAYKQPGLFDAVTGREQHALIRGQIWCQAVSPDGRLLARGTAVGRSYLAEFETGQSRGFLVGHTAPVLAAAFSSDAARLVTGSGDGTARIWDLESTAELQILKGHEGAVEMVCFTPDHRRVVTGSQDGTARIWDTQLGVELCQFPIQGDHPRMVAVSPDGRLVATPGVDDSGAFLRLRGLSNAEITAARREVHSARVSATFPLIARESP